MLLGRKEEYVPVSCAAVPLCCRRNADPGTRVLCAAPALDDDGTLSDCVWDCKHIFEVRPGEKGHTVYRLQTNVRAGDEPPPAALLRHVTLVLAGAYVYPWPFVRAGAGIGDRELCCVRHAGDARTLAANGASMSLLAATCDCRARAARRDLPAPMLTPPPRLPALSHLVHATELVERGCH